MEVFSSAAKEPLGFMAQVSGGGENGTGGATGKWKVEDSDANLTEETKICL